MLLVLPEVLAGLSQDSSEANHGQPKKLAIVTAAGLHHQLPILDGASGDRLMEPVSCAHKSSTGTGRQSADMPSACDCRFCLSRRGVNEQMGVEGGDHNG